MTIDIYILFAAYFISVISLAVALYSLVRLSEVIDYLKKKTPKVYQIKNGGTTKPSKNYHWN